MMPLGVLAGATSPCQGPTSKSLIPASAGVGASGRYDARSLPEVPGTFSFPLFASGMTEGAGKKISWTSFDISAVSACAPPLYGTDTTCVLVTILKSSLATDDELPGVARARFNSPGFALASAIRVCNIDDREAHKGRIPRLSEKKITDNSTGKSAWWSSYWWFRSRWITRAV